MNENTERTPHGEQDERPRNDGSTGGAIQGSADDSSGGALQGESDADDATGGAIQGESSREDSTGGALQGDAGPTRDAPLGGHETTEEQLEAENPAEEDTLKTLDPDGAP